MNQTIASLEAQVFRTARDYLEKNGFIELFPPRLVRATGACENINTLFEVSVDGIYEWFGTKQKCRAYLAQTGQLYLEAWVPKLNKVYCTGPSFRAEPKVDHRHLTEFMMVEIEFAGNFQELLEYIESFVYYIANKIVMLSSQEHKKLGLSKETIARLTTCPRKFPRITYDEAIKRLKDLGTDIEWGDDISPTLEKALLQTVGNQPLFITHYPDPMWDHGKQIEVEKFFNMLPDPERPGRVQSADLILPFGGEAVGSAARVHDLDVLIDRLKNSRMFQRLVKRGGSLDDFSWYTNKVKENGSIPHAGCGFGMARIIQWIKGVENIFDAVSFPSSKAMII